MYFRFFLERWHFQYHKLFAQSATLGRQLSGVSTGKVFKRIGDLSLRFCEVSSSSRNIDLVWSKARTSSSHPLLACWRPRLSLPFQACKTRWAFDKLPRITHAERINLRSSTTFQSGEFSCSYRHSYPFEQTFTIVSSTSTPDALYTTCSFLKHA